MDGIKVGFGEESVEEEPPFGWFVYMKGSTHRRNVHEDSWANLTIAGCSRRQRRGKKRKSVNDIPEGVWVFKNGVPLPSEDVISEVVWGIRGTCEFLRILELRRVVERRKFLESKLQMNVRMSHSRYSCH